MSDATLFLVAATLIHLVLVPGWFAHLIPNARRRSLPHRVMLAVIALFVLIPVMALAYRISAFAPFGLLVILSLSGWWRARKKLEWRWDYLVHILFLAAVTIPVHNIDSINYHLAIPQEFWMKRSIAIDGSNLFHIYVNPIQVLISGLGFDERLLAPALIAIQGMCLVTVLRLMSHAISKYAWIWKALLMGNYLLLVFLQQPLLGGVSILIVTALVLDQARQSDSAPPILWAIVCLLTATIKLNIFLFLLPFLVCRFCFTRDQRRSLISGAFIGVIGLMIFHLTVSGDPLFPWYRVALNDYFREGFLSFNDISRNIFFNDLTVERLVRVSLINNSPVLILFLVPLLKWNRTAWVLMASVTCWWFLMNHTRFFQLFIPTMLCLMASHIDLRSPWFRRPLILTALALCGLRALPSFTTHFQESLDSIRSAGRSVSVHSEFSGHLDKRSCVYIELTGGHPHDDFGWHLPGRVLHASPAQFAWRTDGDWHEAMLRSGVTHLLLAKREGYRNAYYRNDSISGDLLEQYLGLEEIRLARVRSVVEKAEPVASSETHTLYRLR